MAAETKFATLSAHGSIRGAIPATPINEIYVTPNNVKVPLENYTDAQDVVLSFNSFSYGSTATLSISPMYKFIVHGFVRFTIEGEIVNNVGTSWAEGNLLTNPFLQPLVAPSILSSITYQIPGMERQVYKTNSLVIKYLKQMKHFKKQQEFIDLLGNRDSLQTFVPLSGNEKRAVKYYIYFPVPFPSTDFRLDERSSKPLPVHLLGDSIQLTFTIGSKESIFKASAWNSTGWNFAGGVDITYKNFRISEAQLHYTYRQLAFQGEYKNVIQKYPTDMMYSQSVPLNRLALGATYSINLAGVRQGETTQLTLRLSDDQVDRLQRGYRLTDVKVWYGGYLIYDAPNSTSEYYNVYFSNTPSYYDTYRAAFEVPDCLAAGDQRVFWYDVPIANILEHMKGAHNYALGADFNNAELRIEFKIHKESYGLTSSALLLHVDALVTSIIQFNGQSAALIQ